MTAHHQRALDTHQAPMADVGFALAGPYGEMKNNFLRWSRLGKAHVLCGARETKRFGVEERTLSVLVLNGERENGRWRERWRVSVLAKPERSRARRKQREGSISLASSRWWPNGRLT